jgi:hypothetical protein
MPASAEVLTLGLSGTTAAGLAGVSECGVAHIVGYAAETVPLRGVFEHQFFLRAQTDVQLGLPSAFARGCWRSLTGFQHGGGGDGQGFADGVHAGRGCGAVGEHVGKLQTVTDEANVVVCFKNDPVMGRDHLRLLPDGRIERTSEGAVSAFPVPIHLRRCA